MSTFSSVLLTPKHRKKYQRHVRQEKRARLQKALRQSMRTAQAERKSARGMIVRDVNQYGRTVRYAHIRLSDFSEADSWHTIALAKDRPHDRT